LEFSDRLEFHNGFAVNDEVGPDMSDVLALIIDGDDTLRLIGHTCFPQGYFECAMIYGFGIAWTEGRPNVLGYGSQVH
jgi:hypothetical protein